MKKLLIGPALTCALVLACGGNDETRRSYDDEVYGSTREYVKNVATIDRQLVEIACLGVDQEATEADLVSSLERMASISSGRQDFVLRDKENPEVRAAYAYAVRDECNDL